MLREIFVDRTLTPCRCKLRLGLYILRLRLLLNGLSLRLGTLSNGWSPSLLLLGLLLMMGLSQHFANILLVLFVLLCLLKGFI